MGACHSTGPAGIQWDWGYPCRAWPIPRRAIAEPDGTTMPFKKLLIANRGEIAIRIARAADEAGLASAAIYPADDAASLHLRAAGEAHEIPGRGARAYLDIEAVIAAAKAAGCDVLHPGYGF